MAYIQTAKRLNSRQARWQLFFTSLNFVLNFRPWSRNVKLDALSTQHKLDSMNIPEEIVPSKKIVRELRPWSARSRTTSKKPPETTRTQVQALRIGDTCRQPHDRRYSNGDTNPTERATRAGLGTLLFLRRHFWWPSMDRDLRAFGCPVCAQGKPSHQPPMGLLRLLQVPYCLWSHIALDFIMGLPPSNGNSVILTIVDRFSKAAHFVPLSKLPSATETAQLLVHHVVRLHGIPTAVLSDWGAQFSSGIWHTFCRAISVKVSLSSGYHPQTNGQMQRANQHLEATLRCVAAADPISWSSQLQWVEYVFNMQTCTATGRSPFEASVGYQPPRFSEQEEEITVSSVQQHLQRC